MEELQALIADLVHQHHVAFVLSLLGQDALGLSQDQINALMLSDAVAVAQLTGWTVPGMRNPVDAFMFLQLVARQMENATPKMRGRSLGQWARLLDERLDTVDEPEQLLSHRDAVAHAASLKRAGDFAVGVGAEAGQDIKELTARAIEDRWSADELSRELADRSGVWVHNWERIARTELQGAYNEGRVYTALEGYGPGARIARLPETGACKHCRRLFLNVEGLPRIFLIEELAGNGTNVGRKAAAWLPTVWPVHPNCRCDVVTVPPGMVVTTGGRLRLER